MKTLPAETRAEVLSAAQMRAIEQAAIASGAVTGLALMEAAGQAVVDAIFAKWPALVGDQGEAGGQPPDPRDISAQKKQGRSALVLCGPGNNGGDGFVIARLLQKKGWSVEAWFYGDMARQPADAAANAARWLEIGDVSSITDVNRPDMSGHSLIVDALFGTGLSRPLADLGRLLRDICDCVDAGGALPLADRLRHWPPVVAVDIPSGLCADSGRILTAPEFDSHAGSRAACAAADMTVTFHARKRGHLLADGPACCGALVCADIGLGQTHRPEMSELVLETSAIGAQCRPQGHKYSHGHALMFAGGVGKGGAARLAARAALRMGAGAVTVTCPPGALVENAAQLNAIMLRAVKDPEALTQLLPKMRCNAFCIGPGFGLGEVHAEMVAALLAYVAEVSDASVVLDADALTLLSRDSALFTQLNGRCVLTPHQAEFARLFPDLAAQLDGPAAEGPAYSKIDAVKQAAQRAGCVVLLKGADTVIATPDGQCRINAAAYEQEAPWLATAGAGDVLAGFIAGGLARGYSPLHAAEAGAWLHLQCAMSFGPGLIAEDLPDTLPEVFRSLAL